MNRIQSGALGVLAALLLGGAAWAGDLGFGAATVAAVTGLCAVWWTLEPVPIPATSLVPFAVLPFAGVLDTEAIGRAFGHPLILLLLGGFMLSGVMEKSGAHARVAHGVIRALGTATGARTVLAFMLACAFLSMWISNTATTLMLLPVALAVLERASDPARLAAPLTLGLAWSASIGGLGTPVGSPPNMLVLAQLPGWGFADWMMIGLPVVALMIPLTWAWLCRGSRLAGIAVDPLPPRPWAPAEIRALALFAVTAALWVTRTTPFGGWSGWLGTPQVGDHTVALGMVVVAFLLPDGNRGTLLDWPTAVKIPWGLLLLFAGGLALGSGFATSGLDDVVARAFTTLGAVHIVLTVLIIALCVTFLTEITSNTATAALLMPILAAAADANGQDPALWLVPAGLSASCAFMLPVATAPNAIVVGAGHVSTREMAREGFALNLVGAVVVTLVAIGTASLRGP